MLTVRFPTGVSIRYNQANFIEYGQTSWELYTKEPTKGGKFVAILSPASGCIVEALPASAVENPAAGLTGDGALGYVLDNIREFGSYSSRRKLKALKAELSGYNATRCEWKDGV